MAFIYYAGAEDDEDEEFRLARDLFTMFRNEISFTINYSKCKWVDSKMKPQESWRTEVQITAGSDIFCCELVDDMPGTTLRVTFSEVYMTNCFKNDLPGGFGQVLNVHPSILSLFKQLADEPRFHFLCGIHRKMGIASFMKVLPAHLCRDVLRWL